MQRSASHCVYPQRGRMSTQETPQRELRDMIDVYSNDGESDTVWGERKSTGIFKKEVSTPVTFNLLIVPEQGKFSTHTKVTHESLCLLGMY